MVVLEVCAGVLIAALATATVGAIAVGMLGMAGAIRLAPCRRCGRLGVTSLDQPLRSCMHCRHGWVLHPLYQWHHAHPHPHPHPHRPGHGRSDERPAGHLRPW
jgi:hypothetical protein